jgi:S1-C subfamily serine protease
MRSWPHAPLTLLFALLVALSPLARGDGLSRQDLARAGKAASAFVLVRDGTGSAFCIHPSGLFITNHHVVDGGGGEVKLVLNANRKDQRVVKAKVLRTDRDADLALLQAEGVKDLPHLAIGSDDKLSEGDDLVACGFPFGKRLARARDEYPAITVTFGRVTSLRHKSGELDQIQFDAELHPGNSGGPILGADGKVVGLAVSIIPGTNFRFAIPVRKLHRFIEAPTITFEPPAPGPGDWHRPLAFEVRTVSVLPAKKPFEAELILREPGGKERKYPMKRTGDTHRASAPLLTIAGAGHMVHCTVVVTRDGKELARLGNWIVNDDKIQKLYLADMPEANYKKRPGAWDLGIGFVGRHYKHPIRVAGQVSPRSLAMLPNCSISYRLNKGGLLFRSKVGFADTGRPFRGGGVTFSVLGDGKELWSSKSTLAGAETAECSVDVSEVDTLELRVSAEGHNFGAHAVWVEPSVLADGRRLRPEPVVALADRGRTIKDLPAPVDDVALGGGGRYLILSLPQVRKLMVLDVTKASAEKYIALSEAGPVRIAAGADKLLVLYTDKKVLDRYDLTTLKKEASMDLPFEGKVFSMAMGSASHGPLLVVGEKPLFGVHVFVDVQQMRKVPLEHKGQGAAHTGEATLVMAAADGQVFAVGAANVFCRGFHTVTPEEDTATFWPSPDFPFYACPGPDGRVVYTSNGLYTREARDPRKGPRHRGSLCLPAAQGDFYLRARSDSFSLYLLGEETALVRVTGVGSLLKVLSVGWVVNGVRDHALPHAKRIFLVPAADLIVTVPPGSDEVRLHRFAFSRALEKASSDYLFVTAFAPPTGAKGKRFVHELPTHSRKGGVKYQIVSGPRGMTVSDRGKVEWDVPNDYAPGLREVRVRLQDASDREVIHSFRVRVE